MVVRSFYSRCSGVLLCTVLLCSLLYLTSTENVATVNIGALIAYETVIGRVAKQAIEVAVADINRNNSLLNGSKLVLHMLDTNCSAFQGAAAAMELLKKEVVAVVGPQSTAVSRSMAYMGSATQIPIVSFAATDPALSEFQYPYFFRLAHTDAVQMETIASFIGYYGWREVAALYTDDDFGSNGAAALSDALVPVGAQIVQKAALAPGINKTSISSILTDLAAMQTRIFVVHMPQDLAFLLFSEAKYLGMMSAGYVWIVSDSTMGTLGSIEVDANVFETLEGVVGTRGYYMPDSPQLQSFLSEWKNQSLGSNQLHLYGLYAYDSVWMIAYALDRYLRDGVNFTFKDPIFPPGDARNTSELGHLRFFEGGPLLRTHILQTKFSGTSGFIQMNSKGDLIRSAFEIVNIVGRQVHVVGYWTNETQLSLSPPSSVMDASLYSHLSSNSPNSSFQVIWPGNHRDTPRGWVLPKNGRPLKIAAPNREGFKQFVSWSANSSNVTSVHGFCIDVFLGALTYLPYSVPYNFVSFGQDSTPTDDMIEQLANKVYDAVVGTITITTERMEKVDFTQPYTQSGLVVVVPTMNSQSNNAWAFLRPFTPSMWLTTLAFFIFTGVVVWMLEHKKNEDFGGHPKRQVGTVLWFTFSTLFFSQSEKTKSTLGRFVVIIWLFVVLIITSSYTANLTSVLTVQQLTPTIQGISSLQASNVPIGYRMGSFVKDYLINLNIAGERLKPLSSEAAYAEALNLGPNRGGVAAIVDGLVTVQAFLNTQCGFTIAGQEFTKDGWGFAFPKDSELAIDMSTAILTMSENGELQRIHDYWLAESSCDSDSSQVQSNQISLSSFWGLFLVTAVASIACLLIYIIMLLWHFSQKDGSSIDASSRSLSSRSARFIKGFTAYIIGSGIQIPDIKGSTHGVKEKNKKKKKASNHRQDESSLYINTEEP